MSTTANLLENAEIVNFRAGQTVKGEIIDINASRILVDLPGGMTGLVTKREFGGSLAEMEGVEEGATLEAVITDAENDEGLVSLSIRRATQDNAWAELAQLKEEGRNIKVKIVEANKGGLMARYKGLKAFLPVSQLMPLNYPRVEGADSGQILAKLQDHIGKEFVVQVINLSREEGKIIISEKQAQSEKAKETMAQIETGDKVEGMVSGVVKFGIFVTFGGVEGLVHVSELDWEHVSNPGKKYSVGDKVEVLVIGSEGTKLSFSIKRLTEDPWLEKTKDFVEGQEVTGKIARWNDNGVFIEIVPGVQGMFSLDQFNVNSGSELTGTIKDGDEMKGVIAQINASSHRIELKKA